MPSVAKMIREQGGRCPLCGRWLSAEDANIDHIVPLSRGGANRDYNKQAVHMVCNTAKGNALVIGEYRPTGATQQEDANG